ncbi:MAG: type II toxin-antitoxin system PemK/MazF family toxin [Phycisphaerae bacterium]|nr:type II toxin-antitoxin system PemK/MazF family toxin [Phycisphaerae bacterium]
MTRGEVWWAELAGDASFRPVVIVSEPVALQRRANVTIAEVTRAVRSLPCEVPLSQAEGMPADCVINTDNLHTIPKDRLRQRITHLSDENLFRLDQALRHSLGLE